MSEIEAMFRLASLLTGGDRPPVEADEADESDEPGGEQRSDAEEKAEVAAI